MVLVVTVRKTVEYEQTVVSVRDDGSSPPRPPAVESPVTFSDNSPQEHGSSFHGDVRDHVHENDTLALTLERILGSALTASSSSSSSPPVTAVSAIWLEIVTAHMSTEAVENARALVTERFGFVDFYFETAAADDEPSVAVVSHVPESTNITSTVNRLVMLRRNGQPVPPLRPSKGAFVVVEQNHKILVVAPRHKKPAGQKTRIGFPGGTVEPGESFVDAALREVEEETKIVIPRERVVLVARKTTERRTPFAYLDLGIPAISDEMRFFHVNLTDLPSAHHVTLQQSELERFWWLSTRDLSIANGDHDGDGGDDGGGGVGGETTIDDSEFELHKENEIIRSWIYDDVPRLVFLAKNADKTITLSESKGEVMTLFSDLSVSHVFADNN